MRNREATTRELQRVSRRYELVLNSAGEGIFGLDLNANASFVNPAAAKMLGYEVDELVGKSLFSIVCGAQGTAPDLPPPTPGQVDLGRATVEVFRRKDGSEFHAEHLSTPIEEDGKVVGSVVVFKDISERREMEERLAALAKFDTVTGLANRYQFHEKLKEAIAAAKRTASPCAVLLLDLDHFKDVNDTLGHTVGDSLLRGVAERLQIATRETDTVARLGGDEFAVIATNLAECEQTVELASRILADLSEPFLLDGQEVFTAASIGVTLFPSDHGEPGQLLKNADLALYDAKAEGRGTYKFFSAEMQSRIQSRKSMERELRSALSDNQFFLRYQPRVDIASRRLSGVEALIRWQSPDKGVVSPNEFIPVAESTGLIVPLGTWVLEEACRQIVDWRSQGLAPLTVAVNLSAVQFKNANFASDVQRVIERSGIDPRYLELEITKSMAMDRVEEVTTLLGRLKKLGVQLAIDDFGTGYSSLAYLKRFPVDKLKIDRSFVRDVIVDAEDDAIVKTIIGLSKNLGLESVAEGIENEEQFKRLRELGCDEAQGFYFGKPMRAAEFQEWYRAWTEEHATPTYQSAAIG